MKSGSEKIAKVARPLAVLLLAMFLAACGGGGGGGGTALSGTGGGTTTDTTTGTGTTIGTGTTTVVAAASLALTLKNSSGVSTNSITASGTTATATVRDSAGAVVANRLVTFSADATRVTLTPASGQTLTNASGVATVQVAPASLTVSGAGSLTASALVGSATISGTTDYQLSAANVTLQSLNVGATALPAFGNRAISVRVLADGAAVSAPVQVTFSVTCGTVAPASVSTDSTGLASATYTASAASCAGTNVTLTASAVGAAAASGTVSVSPAIATNIQFVSSTPSVIYLTGSTGTTQSAVSFKVVDATGTALQNQSVILSLVNSAPGVSVNTAGNNSPVTLTTNASGLVSVAIFSGTVPTSVQVMATLAANTAVSTTSNSLVVAVGRPTQLRTSISLDKRSIEGGDVDGSEATVTVSLADRQGNPVPDGTQVNLTAESGVLVPPSCVTAGGTSLCSVKIRSQGVRPADGRASILAYLPGDEDFIDSDGNNVFSAGEPFSDLGNAYRDDNENNLFDAGEFVVPRAGTTACAGGTWGRINTCDGVWGTVDVRVRHVLVYASSTALITGTLTPGVIVATITDKNGTNSMPTGSTIGATTVSTAASNACVATPDVTVVPDTYGATTVKITLAGCTTASTVNVLVTAPSGVITSKSFPLSAPTIVPVTISSSAIMFTSSDTASALAVSAFSTSNTCTVGTTSATSSLATIALIGCVSQDKVSITVAAPNKPLSTTTTVTIP